MKSSATELNQFGIPKKNSKEIRENFIDFFKDKNHRFVRSDSIAPQGDPTLLFTNAGMNQFKSIFLGEAQEGLTRAVNSQKCLRVSGKHNDLDEVGRDGTHHTFFEMLGNWSFGDYYKEDAIIWAWDLLTRVWQIPKERLFATVYTDDDEAAEIWRSKTDINPDHIMRFSDDNFWEMGAVGPCGPCSEIHFDWGDPASQEETYKDPILGVNGENERYVEIWNLVFMQNERLADGSLIPLKSKHVDTGSGLERVCSVLQGTKTNYDTDLFAPLIAKISNLSGVTYSSDQQGVPHRVIADHLRAVAFCIADGVTPGNEGRSYVVRRILRRASRFAHRLGQKEPIIYKLVPTLVEIMSEAFPELKERQEYIEQVIQAEELRFLKTLDQGLQLLDKVLAKQQKGETLPGKEAFTLYDTYGFPVDLTEILAAERGFKVDHKGYEEAMQEQKERGRQSAKFEDQFGSDENWQILSPSKTTTFIGYTQNQLEGGTTLRYSEQGDKIYVVVDQTPFYAESGGQVGDTGFISNEHIKLKVEDTFTSLGMYIHQCSLIDGLVSAESLKKVNLLIDETKRLQTRRNHSATHLLQAALQRVLGEHVAQQGSLVSSERLRFDFTHFKGVTEEEKEKIESLVNEQIQNNFSIDTEVLDFAEAKESGATALFGEKYEDRVRVLTMGSFSKELCGGTHAQATGEIGLFRLISESSIAAGVRRIEALTGTAALADMNRDRKQLQDICKILKCKSDHLKDKLNESLNRLKQSEKELSHLKEKNLSSYFKNVFTAKETFAINEVKVFNIALDSEIISDKSQLQVALDHAWDQLPSKSVAVMSVIFEDQLNLMVASSKDLMKTVKAGQLAQDLIAFADGKGGGRPDKARAGSKSPQLLPKVIANTKLVIEKLLTR